jgi:general stress protein CsbA
MSTLLFLPAAALMFGHFVPRVTQACDLPPLDMRPWFSEAAVSEFAESCGSLGLHRYQDLQLMDIAYPAIAALFFVSAIVVLWAPQARSRPWVVMALAAVPVVSMVADYVENVLAWLFLADPNSLSGGAVVLMSSAATLKTATGWLAGSILLAGIVVRLVRRFRRDAAPAVTKSQDLTPAALENAR